GSWASASSRLRSTMYEAVGTPTSRISFLAYDFEPSIRAAAAVGPKARIPSSVRASTTPATSGASGPTTTRSTRSSLAARAIPALPGAAISSGRCGLLSSARTIACSRPPPPTTRTRFTCRPPLARSSERRDELVDRDRRERLVARRPARAELERDPCDRLLVGRLDHVHEVVVAEHRPLGLHRGAELLHLAVHLADARGVVLQRLNALGRESRQEDERRQRASLRRGA